MRRLLKTLWSTGPGTFWIGLGLGCLLALPLWLFAQGPTILLLGPGTTEASSGIGYGYIIASPSSCPTPTGLCAYNYGVVTGARTITRIGVQLAVALGVCSTYPQWGVYVNGSPTGATITGDSIDKEYDSFTQDGAISISVPAGQSLSLGVTVAGISCANSNEDPAETVEYQ